MPHPCHSGSRARAQYRGTSLIRKRPPLGPYSRPVPRSLWWLVAAANPDLYCAYTTRFIDGDSITTTPLDDRKCDPATLTPGYPGVELRDQTSYFILKLLHTAPPVKESQLQDSSFDGQPPLEVRKPGILKTRSFIKVPFSRRFVTTLQYTGGT